MAFPMLAMLAISMYSSMSQGQQKNNALRAEGDLVAKQGELSYMESLKEAEIIRRDGEVFSQKQSLQYIHSGVILGGSALITMKQTRMFAEESASATTRRGKATKDLSFAKRDIAKKEGTASVISGFGNAGMSALSMFSGK